MHPLDNPIWSALSTLQRSLSEGGPLALRFHPDVTALGAWPSATEESQRAMCLLTGAGLTALFHEPPLPLPSGMARLDGGALLQMVHQGPLPAVRDIALVSLGAADAKEMQALAELTRPGPFGPRTHELGGYCGVRVDGKLVAMAGRRLHLPGFVEVSAVCTHPAHLGKGYAAAALVRVMAGIRSDGLTPILHLKAENQRALALYERLGFRLRHRSEFSVLAAAG